MEVVVECAKCECCGLVEDCTRDYILGVRAAFGGRWLCGLCSEAVRDEAARGTARGAAAARGWRRRSGTTWPSAASAGGAPRSGSPTACARCCAGAPSETVPARRRRRRPALHLARRKSAVPPASSSKPWTRQNKASTRRPLLCRLCSELLATLCYVQGNGTAVGSIRAFNLVISENPGARRCCKAS